MASVDHSPRLSQAADAALNELMTDFREKVVEAARLSANASGADIVSAAEVVRAYYKMSEPKAEPAIGRSFSTFSRWLFDTPSGLVATVTGSAVVIIIGVSLVLFSGSLPLTIIGWVYGGIGALLLILRVVVAILERQTRREMIELGREWVLPEDISDESAVSLKMRFPEYTHHARADYSEAVEQSLFLTYWVMIEQMVEKLYSETVTEDSGSIRRPFGAKVSELRRAGLLTPTLDGRLRRLLSARNDLVHSSTPPRSAGRLWEDLGYVHEGLTRLISSDVSSEKASGE